MKGRTSYISLFQGYTMEIAVDVLNVEWPRHRVIIILMTHMNNTRDNVSFRLRERLKLSVAKFHSDYCVPYPHA
jgi:hypothetical protein